MTKPKTTARARASRPADAETPREVATGLAVGHPPGTVEHRLTMLEVDVKAIFGQMTRVNNEPRPIEYRIAGRIEDLTRRGARLSVERIARYNGLLDQARDARRQIIQGKAAIARLEADLTVADSEDD